MRFNLEIDQRQTHWRGSDAVASQPRHYFAWLVFSGGVVPLQPPTDPNMADWAEDWHSSHGTSGVTVTKESFLPGQNVKLSWSVLTPFLHHCERIYRSQWKVEKWGSIESRDDSGRVHKLVISLCFTVRHLEFLLHTLNPRGHLMADEPTADCRLSNQLCFCSLKCSSFCVFILSLDFISGRVNSCCLTILDKNEPNLVYYHCQCHF